MTHEALVHNCAIFAARSLSNSTYDWCANRVKVEYSQYLARISDIKKEKAMSYDELMSAGKNVLTLDEYSILFILNKFAEYQMYFINTFELTSDEELNMRVAMEVVASLYIERFGGILYLFGEYTEDKELTDFLSMERLQSIVDAEAGVHSQAMTLVRDVLPNANMTTGNMLTILPIIQTVDDYVTYYKLLKVLWAVVEQA